MFYNIWKGKSFSDEVSSGLSRITAESIEFVRLLTCKQTRWFEDNLSHQDGKSTIVISLNLKAFVRGYTATVDMSMTMLSIVYDFTTSQIERYRKLIDMLNKSYLPP